MINKGATCRRCLLTVFVLMFFSLPCFCQTDKPSQVRRVYRQKYSDRLVPLLTQVLRFPTVEGNSSARDQQQKWIESIGTELGFKVHNAGLVTEVELAGPQGAPVLGLVVHGDVQPVNEAEWKFPPFAGVEKDGVVYGRGCADDKGPLVQTLLTMAALRDSGVNRTYALRLLVGSDEESTNLDISTYLKTHQAPDISLVLDSAFPVVVGEKAWSAFTVTSANPYSASESAEQSGFLMTKLDAGLSASIVPSQAVAELEWRGARDAFAGVLKQLQSSPVPEGYRLTVNPQANKVVVTAFGKSAHAGVNIEGGRNALVFLARTLHGKLLPNESADLLQFAEEAGHDIYGSGLGLTTSDPLWGRDAVNVATMKPDKSNPQALTLTVNIRALPGLWGKPLQEFLNKQLATFNTSHHRNFSSGGFFDDPPLAFDPNSKIVKRLMADYTRATGEQAPPAISGGGTYAKRIPNAIAFGMWFPGKPYPGHDVDEKITVQDLNRGVDVLVEALTDLATGPRLVEPFKP